MKEKAKEVLFCQKAGSRSENQRLRMVIQLEWHRHSTGMAVRSLRNLNTIQVKWRYDPS